MESPFHNTRQTFRARQLTEKTVIVRQAKISDAHAIAALTTELGYEATATVVSDRLSRILSRGDELVCVVVIDDEVAGWVQAHASEVIESGSRVEIVGLIVAKKFRRRGVGRAMVQEVEQWSARLGLGTVTVRSNVQREESHIFYPALGFSPTKTQRVYRKQLG